MAIMWRGNGVVSSMDCRNPTFVGSEADPEVRLSRFRGWDPKENGTLLGALWCALILHAPGISPAPPAHGRDKFPDDRPWICRGNAGCSGAVRGFLQGIRTKETLFWILGKDYARDPGTAWIKILQYLRLSC